MNVLKFLLKNNKVSIDSADIKIIKKTVFNSITSNPTLILKAFLNNSYNELLNIFFKKKYKFKLDSDNNISLYDEILIFLIARLIPYVKDKISIEIPARISFNYNSIVVYSKKIIFLCEKYNINLKKILIKIPGTDSGIKAAKNLQKIGIESNITLIFDINQVKKCFDNGIFVISPFVGRISDSIFCKYDSGINFIKNIFNYKIINNYRTKIMAASFRNINQIINLLFCDLITIPPLYFNKLNNLFIKNYFFKKYFNKLSFSCLNNFSYKLLLSGINQFNNDHNKLIKLISIILSNL